MKHPRVATTAISEEIDFWFSTDKNKELLDQLSEEYCVYAGYSWVGIRGEKYGWTYAHLYENPPGYFTAYTHKRGDKTKPTPHKLFNSKEEARDEGIPLMFALFGLIEKE